MSLHVAAPIPFSCLWKPGVTYAQRVVWNEILTSHAGCVEADFITYQAHQTTWVHGGIHRACFALGSAGPRTQVSKHEHQDRLIRAP